MITKSKTTKILAVTLAIVLVIGILVATLGATGTAKADSISGEVESGEIITAPEEETKGNWFSENWKTIVEILTSSSALAVILAIIKVFAKIKTLRGDLGSANIDNKAIKEAFNSMVDEVENFKKELQEIHKYIKALINEIATSAEKSGAVLAILEKLITASDLPSETKQSLQAVINKATIEEVSGND